MLNVLKRVFNVLYPDRRPEREKQREREFIQAANGLKTLRVTPEGGMSIDPEELREQIVSAREQLKHLVHNPGTRSGPCQAVAADEVAQEVAPSAEELQDCIEVVAWRRLRGGVAVRYTCLQHIGTGRFIVAAASLLSGDAESLPRWIDSDTHRQVACVLRSGGLHWHATVGQAMDAWDAEL